MAAIARVGDVGIGICYCHSPFPVSYTTTFIGGAPSVTADGLPVMRIGDIGISTCGHTTIAISGSGPVVANVLGVHRLGDTGSNCGPYTCISGSPFVDSL